MSTALMVSKNLIGDGLAIGPALRMWCKRNLGSDIDLLTLPDQTAKMYLHIGLPLIETGCAFRILTDDSQCRHSYDFEFTFDCGKAFTIGEEKHYHIAEAYAEMLLGERLPEQERYLVYDPPEVEHEKGLVLIAPFSKSCSSQGEPKRPPNKMLLWPHWWQILTLLQQVGKVGVLGSLDDRAPLPLSEDQYYCGLPLDQVAWMLRDTKLLVTIDNGVAHLAAAQRTPMIEFYPACLTLTWVAPLGNPRAVVAQVNPASVSLAECCLIIRQGVRKLIEQGALKDE